MLDSWSVVLDSWSVVRQTGTLNRLAEGDAWHDG